MYVSFDVACMVQCEVYIGGELVGLFISMSRKASCFVLCSIVNCAVRSRKFRKVGNH